MKKNILAHVLLLACAFTSAAALAAPCAQDDANSVTGINECLQVRAFGATGSPAPKALVVWLHGDVSSGGPAVYHIPLARQTAQEFGSDKIVSVALVRPGYPADNGTASSGNNHDRADSYTPENMREVGAAVEHLQQRYHPDKTILVGHSGGAATSANLLGMMPALAQGAILVGCPCDINYWRRLRGRSAWLRSEDPSKWLDKIAPGTLIVAMTGTDDSNTYPAVAKAYVDKVKARGIDIGFVPIDGADHNSSFRSPLVLDQVGAMLKKLGAD
ncbi:alpha/beta fold hydrolase [Herbaspirillum sp.]|uniref:alpha/beta hydrolase family protein n=1 Tax=Herbaspirillum sp. TaxID=1890675 RepID=UPI001B204297|nr:alpha/beta fold hydrolase [Herbaspirillum sp.]MBO9535063.1 alpha/beta hydrolase [Herbaspirillum sp.]